MQENKKDRNFSKARELLQAELDIVQLIRQLRFFNVAIDSLLLPRKAELLREASKKTYVGERQLVQYEYREDEEFQMRSVVQRDEIVDYDSNDQKRRV